jgi:hypothetical protein
MKTTIETIKGKPYTVVWHMPTYADDGFKAQDGEVMFAMPLGGYVLANIDCKEVLATALPALPKHPTAEDAALLYLYAAHGLYPVFTDTRHLHLPEDERQYPFLTLYDAEIHREDYSDTRSGVVGTAIDAHDEITHAVTASGERVEIAIKE